MNTQAQNTLSRLRSDLLRSVTACAADAAFGWDRPEDALRVARHLYEKRDRIVDKVVKDLRRNWTVTERARPQRKVPST